MNKPRKWHTRSALLLLGLAGSVRAGGTRETVEYIPPYTPELEARLNLPPEPLVAIYHRGNKTLAFVAAQHVLSARN